MLNIYFDSGPVLIGKHEWRCFVRDSRYGDGRTLEWEWRRPGETHWRSHKTWPRYDFNDSYYGLPMSLKKIYEKHLTAIKAARDDTPADPPKQLSMSLA